MSASLFTGWPLEAPDAGGHLGYAAGAQSLREALWNLLMTAPGERLMRPAFGAGLNQWAGQPNTETTRQLIAATITAAIGTWEQRVSLGGVAVTADPNNAACVMVVVTYTPRGMLAAPAQQLSLSLALGGI
jgi:phage baseplate assembly protein W